MCVTVSGLMELQRLSVACMTLLQVTQLPEIVRLIVCLEDTVCGVYDCLRSDGAAVAGFGLHNTARDHQAVQGFQSQTVARLQACGKAAGRYW